MSQSKRESIIKMNKKDNKIINTKLIPDLIKLIEEEEAKQKANGKS